MEISPEHSLDSLRDSGYEIEETPEETPKEVQEEKKEEVKEEKTSEKISTSVAVPKFSLTIEEEKQVREIWEEKKGDISAKEMYLTVLKGFFKSPEPRDFTPQKNPSWIYFVSLLRKWKSETRIIQSKISAENLSDEEIEKIGETNSKELVILLQATIRDYNKNPEKFKKLSFGDISKLYSIIKQISAQQERLELQRNKLNLDAQKSFLPYQRMSLVQLTRYRDMFNKAVDRILEQQANGSKAQLLSEDSGPELSGME